MLLIGLELHNYMIEYCKYNMTCACKAYEMLFVSGVLAQSPWPRGPDRQIDRLDLRSFDW